MAAVWIVVAAAAGAAGLVAAGAAWFLRRPKMTPAEREKRRRLAVYSKGRTSVATITDFHDGTLCYSYTVRGVEYAATQDLSDLLDLIEDDPGSLLARPAGIKFLPHNPANSIVLCEDWSGLIFGPKSGAGRRRPARSSPA